jgi:two-component system cell cycle response regulator DivK
MLNVLLVEDNKLVRIATERVLIRAGYNVVTAEDGEKALDMAGRLALDVILLDMMLPKLSGPEVLQALKRNPATAQIPVIVVTSLSQKNEERLRQDGAAGFVEKGEVLDKPELLSGAIKNVLWEIKGVAQAARPEVPNHSIPAATRPH